MGMKKRMKISGMFLLLGALAMGGCGKAGAGKQGGEKDKVTLAQTDQTAVRTDTQGTGQESPEENADASMAAPTEENTAVMESAADGQKAAAESVSPEQETAAEDTAPEQETAAENAAPARETASEETADPPVPGAPDAGQPAADEAAAVLSGEAEGSEGTRPDQGTWPADGGGFGETAGGTETEGEPETLPDFSMLNEQGETVTLHGKFADKPVLLNFWATWCPPCRAEMPFLEEAYQEYGDRIEFVMVDMTDGHEETVEVAKAFKADNGYTFPIYFDTAYEGSFAYGVFSIPTTFFIREAGEMSGYQIGSMTHDVLYQQIETLLGTGDGQ